jgi:hypothetical protein
MAAPTGPVIHTLSPGLAPLRLGTGLQVARPSAVRPTVCAPGLWTVSPPSSGTSKCRQRLAEAFGKPGVVGGEGVAQQHTDGLRALRGKIGQVGGEELPRDIRRVLRRQPVDALDHHVMRKDQRFAAELQHRAIIGKAARRRVRSEAPQRGDEGGLGGHRLIPPPPSPSSIASAAEAVQSVACKTALPSSLRSSQMTNVWATDGKEPQSPVKTGARFSRRASTASL